MICLLMKKQSPQVQTYLPVQELYQIYTIYYIILITAVIPMRLAYILRFYPQPDLQEVDIKLLILEEKDGDTHLPFLITFIVMKLR